MLAAYSAEAVVLVAALLALSDREDHQPSRVARVESLLRHRGRVRVLLQRGRLYVPSKPSPALAILDRYVRFVPLDETVQSWHPKLSWVWLVDPDDPEDPGEVRVWLGSRNLTRSRCWDLGVSLLGGEDGAAAPPGLAEALARSGVRAGVEVPDVASLRWRGPAGCLIDGVDFFEADTPRSLELPADAEEVLALSPFLDAGALERLAADCTRTLVTTREAAIEVGAQALRGWTVWALSMPEEEPSPPDPEDEGRPHTWSLHAKAVFARRGDQVEGWLGSPNITARGWSKNAEVRARFRTEGAWLDGLKGLLAEHSRVVDPERLPEPAGDEELKAFERTINGLACVELRQVRTPSGMLLSGRVWERLEVRDVLAARLLGAPGEPSAWARGAEAVVLPASHETELIELFVVRGQGSAQELSRRLVLRAPLEGGLSDERDERLLARWLGLSGLFAWIRALLHDDEPGDGPERAPGDGEGGASDGSVRDQLERFAPSLEEVLRCWQTDPERVVQADREVQRFARLAGEMLESEAERRELEAFAEDWSRIVVGLGVRT